MSIRITTPSFLLHLAAAVAPKASTFLIRSLTPYELGHAKKTTPAAVPLPWVLVPE